MSSKSLKFCNKWWSKIGRDPDLDWQIIIFSSVVLVIIITIYSIYIFLNVTASQDRVIAEETVKINLNSSKLNTVISEYSNKNLEYESLLKNSVYYKDPSF